MLGVSRPEFSTFLNARSDLSVIMLPKQRGNVKVPNLQVLNAILHVAEHGGKWRGLPKRFGRWHTIYMRMNRWSKNGVLDRVFEHLQREQIVRVKVEAMGLDSTIVKVHPDGTGAEKKTARKLLRSMEERPSGNPALVMDRAYEDDATRQLALDLGFAPVVPPKSNRLDPWEYDREMYKRRNEVERLFRRLKGFRRIFSRFEKLDVIFLGFVVFVLIVDALR